MKATGVWQRVATQGGELAILKGIDLEIKAGQSIAIVGASGSGKSTLLGLLAGLDTPSEGTIELGRHELTALSEEQRAQVRGEMVGFVFQNFQLLPALTALENVMLPLELRPDSGAPSELRAQAAALLGQVGLGERGSHFPRQLSGGEQQRVAIARAFAVRPPILFADEPTGNLDTATGKAVADLLFNLNREYRTTLVLVTHSPELAARCERTVTLSDGRLTSDSGVVSASSDGAGETQ